MRRISIALAAAATTGVTLLLGGCLHDFDKFEGTPAPVDAAPDVAPPPPPPSAVNDSGAGRVDAAVDAGPCRATPAACVDTKNGCERQCAATTDTCEDDCGGSNSCRTQCRFEGNRCRGDCERTCRSCAETAGDCPGTQCD